MNKLKVSTLFFFACLIFLAKGVHAQHYSKDILSHKIIVNQDDCNIVAYVKPTKGLPVETDKYYFWFSGNKIRNTLGGYSKKLLHGDYRAFYPNKNLKELGQFYKGLKTGIWKGWNESGKLKEDYTWNFGKKNGVYHKYDALGRVIETGKYNNDVLDGIQTILVGDSTKTLYYDKGVLTTHKSRPGFIKRIFK
ncbi:toxin-antitoxin system YwqK family antitoxin [Pedobacter steynii]|uniref:MORN repeat variant n=1 Tax=Pedobacter steynii TaxID=430522 RepID=A0A1D7QCX1_9SPHI|nr:hypothetical protein [Pedobacter steynii]AOM76530.1 hypothetical protein BFS30_04795 [Pedobacter steynii]